MKYNNPRSKCVSISQRNKKSAEIVEEYSMEWNMDFAPTLWKLVDRFDYLNKKLKNSNWAVLQEMAEL